jgi:curved DNA-binding protein CbpA
MTTRATDYHAVLGVPAGATLADIKKAYRRLARTYHPDKNNGDPAAAAKFREITEAYEALTDQARRNGHGHTKAKTPGTGTAATSVDVQAVSRVLAVLEQMWQAIRQHHPEIPPVVIIIASGTEGKQARWGHHAPGRWYVASQERAEIMISGEGLRRDAQSVLGTLLHEAAHALAAARGIKDTSRQGRYHNKHYKILAEELGITVDFDGVIGWSITTVPGTTAKAYADQLAALKNAMILWRRDEILIPKERRNSNLIAAVCPCGRSIRAAASTLAEAPITCTACGGQFQPKTADA